MSASYDQLIDAAIESLRAHVLPDTTSEFARGQLFSVIFALNGLKIAGDWKPAPLLEQIAIQDSALAAFRRLVGSDGSQTLPELPRAEVPPQNSAELEALRDEGDRLIGKLLAWANAEGRPHKNSAEATLLLRTAVRDQLKVELALTPKSMLHAIATGQE